MTKRPPPSRPPNVAWQTMQIPQPALTRRHFIEGLGAAVAAVGAPLLLASCGGGDDPVPAPSPTPAPVAQEPTETRTLFFNFAHLKGALQKPHILVAAGKRYPLGRVADRPAVLAAERSRNAFLRGVPDDRITHQVEGVVFSAASVTLCYVISNGNDSDGTWEMSTMHFNLPSSGAADAFARAVALTPGGVLAVSNKRKAYGLPAAASAQDLLDEHALVDPTSLAQAMVGLHPEVLSLEPASATHVHNHIIGNSSATGFLGAILGQMDAAAPQGSGGDSPWATLQPVMDPGSPPKPAKLSDGKLNMYYPDWDPTVDQAARQAMLDVHPQVKNDPTLGLDVTSLDPSSAPTSELTLQRNGKLWSRHDGAAGFERSATANAAAAALDGIHYAASQPAVSPGLFTVLPADSDYSVVGDRVQVKLNIANNWFLRWLGMYVQFVDSNGQVIKTGSLQSDTVANQPGPYPRTFDPDDTVVFVDLIPSAATVLGIPVFPGSAASTVLIPSNAATLRIYYGSPASYPSYPPELGSTDITSWPLVMTGIVNYGITGLFTALGVATSLMQPATKMIIQQGAGLVVREIIALVGGLEFNNSFPSQGTLVNALKFLMTSALGPALGAVIGVITGAIGLGEIIDGIPIAGQIARAVAVVTGLAEILQTTIEIAASPQAYLFSIALTHDLSVTVHPDSNNTQFPDPGPGGQLYYKASYAFDGDAASHTLAAVDVPDPTVTSLTVPITGIPRGGKVQVTIGFYVRRIGSDAGQNDWCAGNGESAAIDNTLDVAPDPIVITQNKVAIGPGTVYVHTRKSVLDAQANHLWQATAVAPPFVPPPGGQLPGLGAFNGITVRQGRSSPAQAGYVGYAWKALSSGLNGCRANGPAQYDQFASLNVSNANNGSDAQSGYLASSCGQPQGVQIVYDLLSTRAQHAYLDAETLHIRPIQLDPPSVPDPATATQSYGQLNVDSARLLLHPQGHLISINSDNHVLEMLRPAPAPLLDSDATKRFRGRPTCGLGSRPGRLKNPLAGAVSPEGVILVLEGADGNNRIQAFDLAGNPVAYFKPQPAPYFFVLAATPDVQYLDLAVEFTGYLYVLSKDGSNNHRLDIYHPAQTGTTPICTTQGLNAAHLTVDYWRNVYSLNYEVLTLPNGNIPGFTEPSVSVWTPPVV